MAKYNNVKTVVDGVTFDSKKEAQRYQTLRILEKAGCITDLKCQVAFELIPKQDGERAVKYIADFVYNEDGQVIVEDVKGKKTQVYIIKRKLMLERHGIKILET